MQEVTSLTAKNKALIADRNLEILQASWAAGRAIAKEYSSLLGSLKDKWKSKKLEEMVEIHLQEVTANIFLTEITEGGLQAAGELQRLNENDIEFDTDFALATVSDQVLNELNLLQIFEESMTQGDLPSSRVANDEGKGKFMQVHLWYYRNV